MILINKETGKEPTHYDPFDFGAVIDGKQYETLRQIQEDYYIK